MPTATEPKFLAQRRRRGLELAGQLALPARTDEAWRRTSLEGLELEAYKPAPVTAVLKGSVPAGVIFTDILTAAAAYPEQVGKHLGSLFPLEQNKLTASQAAHLNGGVFLYVPRNLEVTEPLQVEYRFSPGEAAYLHTLVVAEQGASVTLLERCEGDGEYLHLGVTEIHATDGARVRFGYLQNHSQEAWNFSFRRTRPGRDTTVEFVGGEFGSALTRSEMVADIAGEGARSTISVVFGASNTQHMDIVAAEVHAGSNSSSNILGRGMLSGKAHTVFRGNGQINKGARNCSTYQRQQALVLSEKARADSIPALIIDENEVAGAGHAATVGQLDEEQLFYLMARGLSRKEAVRMLVLAFLAPVLDQVPVADLRDEMTRLMGEKVSGQ